MQQQGVPGGVPVAVQLEETGHLRAVHQLMAGCGAQPKLIPAWTP
jgi:hypothetical protein